MKSILLKGVFRVSAKAKRTLVIGVENRWCAERCMMKEAGAWF